MPFTAPPTAVTGSVVTIAYTNVFSDNDNWFNGLLPAPGAANQIPISSSTSAATWGFANTSQIADGAITSSVVGTNAATSAKFAAGAVTEAKLETAVSGGLAIAGMVAWVRKASEIPSGWPRETALDGRVAVSAGTTFGQTFVEATDYGASWAHNHSISDTSDATVDDITSDLKNDTGGWPASDTGHTHALSGGTQSTTWAVPTRAVVFVRKS